MFDTLQALFAVPVINEPKKIDPLHWDPPAIAEARHCDPPAGGEASKPAIVIPMNADIKIIAPISKAPQKLPFEKWNLPVQAEGYIKGKRCDFL